MKKYPEIKTERLLLRGFQPSDAAAIQELAGVYEVAEMTLNIPHPYLDGMAETWIETHQEDFESGGGVVFAMIDQKSKLLIIKFLSNRCSLEFFIKSTLSERIFLLIFVLALYINSR